MALVAFVAVQQRRPAGGEIRLAVIAGESIYANARLRLTANQRDVYETSLKAMKNLI